MAILRALCWATLAVLTVVGCGERASQAPQSPAPNAQTPSPQPPAPRAPEREPAPPVLALPTGVTPLAYRLDLTVLPERETFSGRARIDIRFDAPTKGFWLHGRGLDVDAIVLRGTGDTVAASYRQATPDGVARIALAREIPPQTAQLDIRYRGRFSELLEGLFRVQVDRDWYAFTQFEPIDARGVFPSFDEPRFKTPFTLSIVAPRNATVAANSPVAEIASLPDGTQRVLFEPTAPLPTYLLAFTVGPLDIADGGTLHGDATAVPLRGLAAKGRGDALRYALSNTPDLIAQLEAYFGLPYPYKKLDLLAVTSQQGAMENPGLVTFGEYVMLLGDHPPLSQQRAFAAVTAHELAHQWFGDSVTMRWWDDLWLNEAFATFMSAKVVQAWRPSYHADEALVRSALAVMNEDALASTRRIREPIADFNDITNAFDGITYQKGAGVLNMIEGFTGAVPFRDGIRAYLRKHAGGSATMSDLVGSLVESTGRGELVGIMNTFTELPGTPTIDVALHCGAAPASVTLRQQRYLPIGSSASANQQWSIPVCMRFGVVDGVREQCVVLDQPTMDVALDGVEGCPTWLLPNRGGRGYYRWRLDDTRFDRLTSVMYSALDAGERLALADSLVANVEAGGANLAAFFQRVPQLLKTRERYLLMTPIPLWRSIQVHLLDEPGRAASRARMRDLYGPVLGELRRRGVTSDEDRLTQSALVAVLAIDARDPILRSELTRSALAFTGFDGDGALHRDALDGDLVNVALKVAAQEADAKFGEHLAAQLRDTEDAVLRFAYLGAIGAANDPTLAQRLALDDSIRGDDYLNLLGSMFSIEQADANWAWLSANVDALLDKAPTFERSTLVYLTQDYCSNGRADTVAALFEPRLARIEGGRRALDQTLEHIRSCVALRGAYSKQARALFH